MIRLTAVVATRSLRWHTIAVASRCYQVPFLRKDAMVYFSSTPSDPSSSSLLSSTSSSSTLPWPSSGVDPQIQSQVLSKCTELHSSIMPLNEKLRGPLARHSERGTSLPFVFLVGNHSSGKSSFINYVVGRSIQSTGVAPTDDCFTVIAPGPVDSDQDGPALIGDPDMGFGPLRQFGPTLVTHTQLKIRSDLRTNGFMLIDSPGMIDSPANYYSGLVVGERNLNPQAMDRGYDFAGVVKWFAERADIVLLFFDPDKPGTTGETLSILLHSLAGMDHKLLIVLNKADQFKKIHDFARAYGSLCWNLSKVIPRKDLPRIFTMCLPIRDSGPSVLSPSSSTNSSMNQPPNPALADLYQNRDEVVAEVMKAPKRRIDNAITQLHDSVSVLLLYAKITEDIRKRYAQAKWNYRLQEASAVTLGAALTSLAVYSPAIVPTAVTGGVVATTILGVGGLTWFNLYQLREMERFLVTPAELSAAFQRTHAQEVREADEFTASLWQRIRESLRISMEAMGLPFVPTVSPRELARLKHILEVDIPALRRLASPPHFGSSQRDKENRNNALEMASARIEQQLESTSSHVKSWWSSLSGKKE